MSCSEISQNGLFSAQELLIWKYLQIEWLCPSAAINDDFCTCLRQDQIPGRNRYQCHTSLAIAKKSRLDKFRWHVTSSSMELIVVSSRSDLPSYRERWIRIIQSGNMSAKYAVSFLAITTSCPRSGFLCSVKIAPLLQKDSKILQGSSPYKAMTHRCVTSSVQILRDSHWLIGPWRDSINISSVNWLSQSSVYTSWV